MVYDSSTGVTTYREALVVGGAVVGQFVTTSADNTPHYDYFYTDQIGNVTEIADGSGNLEQALSHRDHGGLARLAVA